MSVITTRPTGVAACCPILSNIPVVAQLQPIAGMVIVNAAATTAIDAIPLADYRGAKWFVAVVNHHTNDVDMYEVYGIHQDGTAPFHTVYSIQGNGVNHTVDVVISGANLQLEVTNNESNEIVVYVTRMPVPRVTTPTIPIPTDFEAIHVIQIPDTTIPAGDTVNVDTVPFRYHKAEKWLLTLLDLTAGNIEAREVYSVHGVGQFTDTEYAIVGPVGINATIEVVVSGTTVVLRVENNEANDIAIVGSRVPISTNQITVTAPTTNCVTIPGNCIGDVDCAILLTYATGVSIPPATTVIVDQVNHVNYHQVKWLLAASDDSTDTTMGFQVNMVSHYGNPSHTVYSQIAAGLNLDVDVVTSGLNVNLEITNNEAFTVYVDVVRVPVSM